MTNTELALLGLAAEQPRYGYEIEQLIEQRGMREWAEIGLSSIYYVLNKLEESGLLEAEKLPGPGERPARKIYHLTPAGMEALRAAVKERLSKPRPRTADFDLALSALPVLSTAETLHALRICRANLALRLKRVATKQFADQDAGMPPHAAALFDRSLALIQAELTWVSAYITRLETQKE